jgi:cytochrome c
MTRFFACVATAMMIAGLPLPASAQDAAAGNNVFSKCRSCHQVGPTARNGVGPMLNGLFGRKAGSIEGFNYSRANKESGVVWDDKTFADYIRDPRKFMPGNKMVFPGLPNEKDALDVAAFLKQYERDGTKR